ncbi:hypothetical protein QQF64_007503 [Cirrhinus molitorella]|uniref:Secreted protein n=1 Tax=Cirrhinus molitorella TaxID=172907 RepID=A0ABR3MAY2_9TELE
MRNTRSWRKVPELFFLFWLECAEPGPNTALLFTPSSWMCFLEVKALTHRKISQMDRAQTPGLQSRRVITTLHYDQLYFSTDGPELIHFICVFVVVPHLSQRPLPDIVWLVCL